MNKKVIATIAREQTVHEEKATAPDSIINLKDDRPFQIMFTELFQSTLLRSITAEERYEALNAPFEKHIKDKSYRETLICILSANVIEQELKGALQDNKLKKAAQLSDFWTYIRPKLIGIAQHYSELAPTIKKLDNMTATTYSRINGIPDKLKTGQERVVETEDRDAQLEHRDFPRIRAVVDMLLNRNTVFIVIDTRLSTEAIQEVEKQGLLADLLPHSTTLLMPVEANAIIDQITLLKEVKLNDRMYVPGFIVRGFTDDSRSETFEQLVSFYPTRGTRSSKGILEVELPQSHISTEPESRRVFASTTYFREEVTSPRVGFHNRIYNVDDNTTELLGESIFSCELSDKELERANLNGLTINRKPGNDKRKYEYSIKLEGHFPNATLVLSKTNGRPAYFSIVFDEPINQKTLRLISMQATPQTHPRIIQYDDPLYILKRGGVNTYYQF